MTEATEEFSFPRLTLLNLHMLPQLTCFYPGRFTLECPELNHLEVLFCDNLETFQSQQNEESSTSVNRQPLFSEEKVCTRIFFFFSFVFFICLLIVFLFCPY